MKIQTYSYMFIFRSKCNCETFLKGKTPEVNMMDINFKRFGILY